MAEAESAPAAGRVAYEPHPLALGWPLLEGADYDAFKADIRAHGLRMPLWLYNGKLLDGRNRDRVCRELGIEPDVREFVGTEAAAKAFVDSVNFHRRHLTAEWRRQRVAELRAEGKSTRQIAGELGVGQRTVVRDLQTGESDDSPAAPDAPDVPDPGPLQADAVPPAGGDRETGSQDPPATTATGRASPPRVKGRDGKRYPATTGTGKRGGESKFPRAKGRGPVGHRMAKDAIEALRAAIRPIPADDPEHDSAVGMVAEFVVATLSGLKSPSDALEWREATGGRDEVAFDKDTRKAAGAAVTGLNRASRKLARLNRRRGGGKGDRVLADRGELLAVLDAAAAVLKQILGR